MISVIWITGLYLIAFAPWLHIPVYVGPLVMYGVLFSLLFLPLPVLRPRSRIWLLKRLVSQSNSLLNCVRVLMALACPGIGVVCLRFDQIVRESMFKHAIESSCNVPFGCVHYTLAPRNFKLIFLFG